MKIIDERESQKKKKKKKEREAGGWGDGSYSEMVRAKLFLLCN